MLKRLYHFGKGYVRICLRGDSVGRFFNLCTHNGIRLWDICMISEQEYHCFVMRESVWELHPFLRKTHTGFSVIKRRGIPFFLFRYRKRILFPATFVCVAFLFGYCSRFIWKIDVEGNSFLTKENLIDYLEEQNAGFGTSKADIDCDKLELSLREDFSQIIWASVSIEGTNLIVVIQEKADISQSETGKESYGEEAFVENEPPANGKLEDGKLEDGQSYCIVANKDAVIHSIVTRTGTPQVKAGDVVHAGDVLVVGHQEILNDSGEIGMVYDACADADIIGEVRYEYSDMIPVEETIREYQSGHVVGIYLNVGERRFSIPLGFRTKKESEQMEEYHQLCITDDFYLPVGVGICREYPITETVISLGKEAALDHAEENFHYFLDELEENGVSIIDKNVMMCRSGQNYKVFGSILAREAIGELSRETAISDMEGTDTDEHE